jgi:hypothetical protein
MRKFVVAVLLALVCASPAFAWKHHHSKPKPSHPQAIHQQNPWLKHPQHRKPHPVPKNHPA